MLTASALRIVDVTPKSLTTYTIPGAEIEDAKGLVWLAFQVARYTSDRTTCAYLKNVMKLTRPRFSHFFRSGKFLPIVRNRNRPLAFSCQRTEGSMDHQVLPNRQDPYSNQIVALATFVQYLLLALFRHRLSM